MLLPCVSVLWGAELPPTAAASSAPHVPAPLCPPAHAAARRAGSQHDAEPWLPLEQGFSMETPVRNKMCRRGSARAIQSLCWGRLHRCVVALALLQWCCSFDPQPWAVLCSALWHPSGKANWNLGGAQPPCWNRLYKHQKKPNVDSGIETARVIDHFDRMSFESLALFVCSKIANLNNKMGA